MIGNGFYKWLVIRVVLIVLSCFAISLAYVNSWYLLMVVAVLLLIGQTIWLIAFLNKTNRKLAYFFNAIENEDFTLRFPEEGGIGSHDRLNQGLNRINASVKKLHLKLQSQEQYYQTILKEADIGIMAINEHGHIAFSNKTLEKLLNHAPLNHVNQFKRIDAGLYTRFKTVEPFERTIVKMENERGAMQLAIKAKNLRLGNTALLVAVVQDIHYELDRKQTDSWVKLIRVLTHEIMNTVAPMTSISDSILRIFKDGKQPLDPRNLDKANKGLKVIKQQGNDLMDFVLSYRELLNVPQPDRALVKVQDLFERLKVLVESDFGGDVEILWYDGSENKDLFIDEKLISLVMINLIKNAVQSVSQIDGGALKIESGIFNESDNIYISVTDNGPGIPLDTIENIFVPFFTTKEKGSGIGLSLSKQIMQLHGGQIKVSSVPNEKTTFILIF